MCDFGFAKVRAAVASGSASTSKGVSTGTLLWKAPEQFGGRKAAGRSTKTDVYAFGITMWEVLARRIPYAGVHLDVDELGALLNDADEPLRPTLALLPADVPPVVVELMQRCWSGNAASRPTMADVVGVLKSMPPTAVEAAAAKTPTASDPSASVPGTLGLSCDARMVNAGCSEQSLPAIENLSLQSASTLASSQAESPHSVACAAPYGLYVSGPRGTAAGAGAGAVREGDNLHAAEVSGAPSATAIISDNACCQRLHDAFLACQCSKGGAGGRTLVEVSNLEGPDQLLAMGYLAILFADGAGFRVNLPASGEYATKALPWLMEQAATGNVYARDVVDSICAADSRVHLMPAASDLAVAWHRRAADGGDATAQWTLGKLYATGKWVPLNPDLAGFWYAKCAVQGDPSAQYKLAESYASGSGVRQNDVQAMEWFTKAAAQGHEQAQWHLGDMYHAGRGAAQNTPQADFWYSKAKTHSSTAAADSYTLHCYAGHKLYAAPDGNVDLLRDDGRDLYVPPDWQTWQVVVGADGRTAFRSSRGKYLYALPDGTLKCDIDAGTLTSSHTWTVVPLVDSNVALQAANGRYLGSGLKANRSTYWCDEWWKLVKVGDLPAARVPFFRTLMPAVVAGGMFKAGDAADGGATEGTLVHGAAYIIKPQGHQGTALDVKAGVAGGAVLLWNVHGGKNQVWHAHLTSRGVYEFAPLAPMGARLATTTHCSPGVVAPVGAGAVASVTCEHNGWCVTGSTDVGYSLSPEHAPDCRLSWRALTATPSILLRAAFSTGVKLERTATTSADDVFQRFAFVRVESK